MGGEPLSIRSMTGFGRAGGETVMGSVHVEVKSVNHRYLDIALRLPRDLSFLEEDVKACIRETVSRGRVELNLRLQSNSSKGSSVSFDHSIVKAYVEKLRSLSSDSGLELEIRLQDLLSLPGVLGEPELTLDEQEISEQVKTLVRDAARALQSSRAVEGERLQEDLLLRLSTIEGFLDQIEERAALASDCFRQRLQENVMRLVSNASVDPERLEQEVVLLCERSSIVEELVRLRTHTKTFKKLLLTADAVGRKMDFYIQEMNREANTIGSKAQDVGISQLVVEIKSELEKVREQVQNIE